MYTDDPLSHHISKTVFKLVQGGGLIGPFVVLCSSNATNAMDGVDTLV
jgi:UDP-N-acetylmuramyl pentapeptide phosphotransferase/UDP-N-acetylglucosamine-1-phosphate transferase